MRGDEEVAGEEPKPLSSCRVAVGWYLWHHNYPRGLSPDVVVQIGLGG